MEKNSSTVVNVVKDYFTIQAYEHTEEDIMMRKHMVALTMTENFVLNLKFIIEFTQVKDHINMVIAINHL